MLFLSSSHLPVFLEMSSSYSCVVAASASAATSGKKYCLGTKALESEWMEKEAVVCFKSGTS